jgi:hypothetical protein
MSSLATDAQVGNTKGEEACTNLKIDFNAMKSVTTVNSRSKKGRKSLFFNNLFFKPIGHDIRGKKEQAFYEEIWSNQSKHTAPGSLALGFLPKYYGVECNEKNEKFIKIGNLEAEYRKPCVIDLKIGTQTYDEDASDEKKEKQIKKFKYQQLLGYRLTGMKVYDLQQQCYRKYDSDYGKHMTNLNAGQGLLNYFFNGRCIRLDAVRSIKSQLEYVLKWFEEQTDYRFYGHSLLFLYEGLDDTNSYSSSNKSTNTNPPILTSVKLIDFAHWYKSKPGENRKDCGSIKGIKHILKALTSIEKYCTDVQVALGDN